ncbi:MAG: 30S ribosomal protein S16 [Gordonia sp. (in: high G+C Gram-positive bacteria)]|uniref:30S ribosomal protein S16 n=1 Tax=Gordonia sp. (in: high G+C Gram-positive bacteria) TaxID=84139 RepID=UPI0039E33661
MAVKIKLTRLGKIRNPQYRIIVADSRTRRNGRAIETIGKYHPKEEPSLIEVDSERAQYWLSVGAQPTEPVAAILKITGDWQKFKGEKGSEGTLKVKEAKPSKQELFAAALAAAENEPTVEATTAKKKAAAKKKADAAKADEAKADEAAVEEVKDEVAQAEPETKAEAEDLKADGETVAEVVEESKDKSDDEAAEEKAVADSDVDAKDNK